MKKALFIDRDGTIVIEPPVDYQLDSLEKFEFVPGVIRNLYKIATLLDYELVMVTNQDGLGTDSFPEEDFWPPQNLMMKTLSGEGIEFDEVVIDKTFEHENMPTRKPGTALLTKYLEGDYDLANSYVIGDRLSDVELAKNLGSKAIYITDKPVELEPFARAIDNWDQIYSVVSCGERKAEVVRKTAETDIDIRLNLDGTGGSVISTGLNFFDHMLDQIGRHSGVDLTVIVKGDLEVDEHHTIEDTGIALGEAFAKAMVDKRGVERYGFYLPMDDSIAKIALDFGGRGWLVWDVEFKREYVGDMPTEMIHHFFKSFADNAKINLNISASGDNEHHKIEAIFKGLARAIKMAIKRDVDNMILPSTKESL